MVSMPKHQQAPGELELVRDFVNTLDAESALRDPARGEELSTARALERWLVERALLPRGARAGSDDLERARSLREALRAHLAANAGEPLDPRTAAVLDDCAARAGLRVRFGADGASRLEPGAPGVDGALGRLLAVAAAAMADGSWSRLKACRAETCRWAFYDHTRNRSGVWCTMDVCGNRTKVRAFRRRQGAGG
jgi:predicted RNA-binding Zn ribbon-like protein